MSQALRTVVRRSTPLIFIPLLFIFAAAGCSGTSSGAGMAFKKSSNPAIDKSQTKSDSKAQEDEFLSDPLGESGNKAGAAPKTTAKAHPKNVLKTAFSQVGKPYRYGGSKPETGFDCSGFVKWVYSQYGIGLPRSSGDMMGSGTSISRKDLKPGDLVFFGKKKRITHVGIYTGDNKYIHSPSSGKSIKESSLDDRARGEYYAGARRLLKSDGRSGIDSDQKSAWVAQAEREMAVAKAAASAKVQAKTEESAPKAIAQADEQKADPIVVAESAGNDNVERQPVQVAASEVKTEAKSKPAPAGKAPASAQKARKHQVASGDTIYTLARKYGVTREALAKANNLEGEKAALLKLGQTLTIPASSTTTTAKSASAKAPAKKHKVASGDTLYDLARKYGVSADALAKANALEGKKVANLKLGQTLVIPAKN